MGVRAESNLEAFIATQLNPPHERCEFDRPRRRAPDAEEGLVRFGMQIQIVLRRVTVRTMIGEIAFLVNAPEEGLPVELPGEGAVHRSDFTDGKLLQRLI